MSTATPAIQPLESPSDWTWADQLSSYRFWGLCLFYILSLATITLLNQWHYTWGEVLGITRQELALTPALIHGASFLGFWLAWATIHWKPVPTLWTIGGLLFIGTLALTIEPLVATPIRFLAAMLVGLAYGTILISVPAIFAGGIRSSATFVIVFGAAATFNRFLAFALTFASDFLTIPIIDNYGYPVIHRITNALSVLAILFLLPVRTSLFNTPPPDRSQPLRPITRNPVTVALLAFIPLYNIFHVLYWVSRVHGEVAYVAPSKTLLSPRAAIPIALFVPFILPIIVASLAVQLNKRASELGVRSLPSVLGVFLWSIFLFPIAMDHVQRALNTIAAESNK